jgi:hypothetical protein
LVNYIIQKLSLFYLATIWGIMIGIRISQSTGGSSERSSRNSSTTSPASVVDGAALVPRNRGSAIRTLDDVREQVAQEIAINTRTKAKSVDGKKNLFGAFKALLLKFLQTPESPSDSSRLKVKTSIFWNKSHPESNTSSLCTNISSQSVLSHRLPHPTRVH